MQPVASVPKKLLWTGRVISTLPAILFVATGLFSLFNPQAAAQGMDHLGYPLHLARVIGALELVCAIVYVIPQTAVLGAILLTGYLGGATASHVRIGEPPVFPLVVAAFVWLGIYLREPRLKEVTPIRRYTYPSRESYPLQSENHEYIG